MATNPQVIPPGHEDEEVLVPESSVSKLEEADRRSQVSVAQDFPRSITVFRRQLQEIATYNQQVSMEMMYSLPRAGKQLIGPSIRFAEALVSCWKNARVSVEVVDVDTREGHVTAEGRFYDAEANVGFAIRVRRRNVMTKKDADSYQVTGNAASSIALRNAIIRGIPKALWADIFDMAKKTAAGDAVSMTTLRVEMVKLFTAVGVTEKRLFNTLGIQGIEDIGPEEVIAMKAWRKQLTEKESTIEDIFGSPIEEEVESLMKAMAWPEAKKRQSRDAFKGNLSGHLQYLKDEAGKAGIKPETAQAAPAARPAATAPAQEQEKAQGPTSASATAADAASTSQQQAATSNGVGDAGNRSEPVTATNAGPTKKHSSFDDF